MYQYNAPIKTLEKTHCLWQSVQVCRKKILPRSETWMKDDKGCRKPWGVMKEAMALLGGGWGGLGVYDLGWASGWGFDWQVMGEVMAEGPAGSVWETVTHPVWLKRRADRRIR